jgi:hypothetical protein
LLPHVAKRADIPKFRKHNQIGAEHLRMTAVPKALSEISALIVAIGGNLEKGNLEVHKLCVLQVRRILTSTFPAASGLVYNCTVSDKSPSGPTWSRP